MSKVKAFFVRCKKKIVAGCVGCSTAVLGLVGASAADPTTSVDSMINEVKSTLQSQFSVENLIKIIIAALGVTVVFGLLWFAYRWIVRKVTKALKSGKIG